MQRIALGTVVIAVVAASGVRAADEARRSVTILYTINNQGYLDPCG